MNLMYIYYVLWEKLKREKRFLEEYKRRLETEKGLKVHYPAKDTDQTDETGGYRICKDHCREIKSSKTAHVYWTGSTGSHVDLGTILAEHFERNMDVILINKATVRRIVEKQRIQGITKSY